MIRQRWHLSFLLRSKTLEKKLHTTFESYVETKAGNIRYEYKKMVYNIEYEAELRINLNKKWISCISSFHNDNMKLKDLLFVPLTDEIVQVAKKRLLDMGYTEK